ncbi:MAG: hypothetical protein ACL7BU_06675 [Candidatus Phlomobacter fragariae]
MKTFNRPQSLVLLMMMLLLTYLSGSVLFFLFYFHQIREFWIFKSGLSIFSSYRMEVFNKAILDSAVIGTITGLSGFSGGFGDCLSSTCVSTDKTQRKR